MDSTKNINPYGPGTVAYILVHRAQLRHEAEAEREAEREAEDEWINGKVMNREIKRIANAARPRTEAEKAMNCHLKKLKAEKKLSGGRSSAPKSIIKTRVKWNKIALGATLDEEFAGNSALLVAHQRLAMCKDAATGGIAMSYDIMQIVSKELGVWYTGRHKEIEIWGKMVREAEFGVVHCDQMKQIEIWGKMVREKAVQCDCGSECCIPYQFIRHGLLKCRFCVQPHDHPGKQRLQRGKFTCIQCCKLCPNNYEEDRRIGVCIACVTCEGCGKIPNDDDICDCNRGCYSNLY